MSTRWISWEPRGRDPYTNPRSRVAHAFVGSAGDISNGSFPLACGRWAPDGWDANIHESSGRRCRRCEKALQAQAPQQSQPAMTAEEKYQALVAIGVVETDAKILSTWS